jgi:hypothetical protein
LTPHAPTPKNRGGDTAETERQITLLGEDRAGEISFQAQQALDELLAEHSREAA